MHAVHDSPIKTDPYLSGAGKHPILIDKKTTGKVGSLISRARSKPCRAEQERCRSYLPCKVLDILSSALYSASYDLIQITT